MQGPEIRRLYYTASDVCRIAEIRPSLLRSWESRFDLLKPARSRTGRRLFRPKDLEIILRIRTLKAANLPDSVIDHMLSISPVEPNSDSVQLARVEKLLDELSRGLKAVLDILNQAPHSPASVSPGDPSEYKTDSESDIP